MQYAPYFLTLFQSVNQRNIYRAVCFGHDGLIYAVARNIEFDARYNTVLRGLFDKTRSVGFGIKLEIEIYRVGSARNHCLLAYAAPDKHFVAIQINGFLCGYRIGEVIILSLVKVY